MYMYMTISACTYVSMHCVVHMHVYGIAVYSFVLALFPFLLLYGVLLFVVYVQCTCTYMGVLRFTAGNFLPVVFVTKSIMVE